MEKHPSYREMIWRRYKKSKVGMVALFMIFIFVFVAVFAPLLANDKPYIMLDKENVYFPLFIKHKALIKVFDYKKYVSDNNAFALFPPVAKDPHKTDIRNRLDSPSFEHPMGTDELGRDILARMIYGASVSLIVGIFSSLFSLVMGIFFGAIAGYFGGNTDFIISRFIEIIICFPTFFILLAIISMIRPSVFLLVIIMGLFGWTGKARLLRGEFFRIKNLDYIQAARITGASNTSIIFKHIFPNAMTPVLVVLPFSIAGGILGEASLSFLGYGVQPPTASWGQIMEKAINHIDSWWLFFFPGLALFYTVLGFNLIGEIVRDAVDPKSNL